MPEPPPYEPEPEGEALKMAESLFPGSAVDPDKDRQLEALAWRLTIISELLRGAKYGMYNGDHGHKVFVARLDEAVCGHYDHADHMGQVMLMPPYMPYYEPRRDVLVDPEPASCEVWSPDEDIPF